jgi:hypothetical protein
MVELLLEGRADVNARDRVVMQDRGEAWSRSTTLNSLKVVIEYVRAVSGMKGLSGHDNWKERAVDTLIGIPIQITSMVP